MYHFNWFSHQLYRVVGHADLTLILCSYNMGLIPTKKSLVQCAKLDAASFCRYDISLRPLVCYWTSVAKCCLFRRRLPIILVRNKFCENLKEAVKFVEQGRILPKCPAGEIRITRSWFYALTRFFARILHFYCLDIRVGPDVVTDPAFLVTRYVILSCGFSLALQLTFRTLPSLSNMEDFVTWADSSKIRKKILKYNDKLDDFDFLDDWSGLFR